MKFKVNYLNIVVILVLFFCFISVQAKGATKGYTLEWDANSEPDLAGYKIYVQLNESITVDSSPAAIIPTGDQALATVYQGLVEIPDNAVTTIYCRVTAYDTAGLESDFSNEVSKTWDLEAPAAPKNLKWYDRLIKWFKGLFGKLRIA